MGVTEEQIDAYLEKEADAIEENERRTGALVEAPMVDDLGHPGPVADQGDDVTYVDYDEEIDGSIENLTVTSEEIAEDTLEVIAYWANKAEAIKRHAQQRAQRIEEWRQGELEKIERKIAWHEHGLERLLATRKAKTINLINGTLKRRAGREYIRLPDSLDEQNQIFQSLSISHPDLVERKVQLKLDKAKAIKHIRDTGEIPDGLDVERAEERFYVNIADHLRNKQ